MGDSLVKMRPIEDGDPNAVRVFCTTCGNEHVVRIVSCTNEHGSIVLHAWAPGTIMVADGGTLDLGVQRG